MKQKLLFIIYISFMLVLIAFPDICISGAKEGLILWYKSIVPTLLPYMMLTNMLINTGVFENIKSKNRFISLNTLAAIFIGFLCGYPMGAYYVGKNYKAGNINKNTAYWLLSFVNLCSPAFIIQYIILENLNGAYTSSILISVYGSAIMTGIVTFPYYYLKRNTSEAIVADNDIKSSKTEPISDAIMQCLKLAGYIIIFSIILNMVTALINTVTISHIILVGILEITNGISFVSENMPISDISVALISAITAFGSVSCIFQTGSVCADCKLNILPYIIAKCIQALFSLLIMYIIILFK